MPNSSVLLGFRAMKKRQEGRFERKRNLIAKSPPNPRNFGDPYGYITMVSVRVIRP
jgi:hypothetical protein